MLLCPYCGAENPDGSAFCSLCLSRFVASTPPPSGEAMAPRQMPEAPQQSQYVSPGDYRALAQEMARQPQTHGAAYRVAAISHPGAIASAPAPSWARKRGRSDVVLLVLKYSLLAYILLFAVNFIIGLFIFGAAFGGSESGFNFGIGMLYLADAAVLVLTGYYASMKAMHAGKGWAYGAACVAAVVFFWEPLISLAIVFFISGKFFVPIFNLVGILVTVFLYLPLGALGGWVAEKRYMG